MNFIYAYKPPDTNNMSFLDYLDSLLFQLNPNEPVLIIGDLNMDLKSSKGMELKNFIIYNNLENKITGYTRICTKFYQKKNEYKTSKSLIDVAITNGDIVNRTKIVGCPFSDHNMILLELSIKPSQIKINNFINCRNLSKNNINAIEKKFLILIY